jgi:hypothetical protein
LLSFTASSSVVATKMDIFLSRWGNMLQTKINSVALSPQANFTDWATATCRRNLVPNFVDREVSRGQRGGSPTVVNLSFLDRSRYFSFKQLLIYPHKGWVDPVPDTLLLRKSGSTRNRTRDLWVNSQKLETRWNEWFSSIYVILLPTLGPGVNVVYPPTSRSS